MQDWHKVKLIFLMRLWKRRNEAMKKLSESSLQRVRFNWLQLLTGQNFDSRYKKLLISEVRCVAWPFHVGISKMLSFFSLANQDLICGPSLSWFELIEYGLIWQAIDLGRMLLWTIFTSFRPWYCWMLTNNTYSKGRYFVLFSPIFIYFYVVPLVLTSLFFSVIQYNWKRRIYQ